MNRVLCWEESVGARYRYEGPAFCVVIFSKNLQSNAGRVRRRTRTDGLQDGSSY